MDPRLKKASAFGGSLLRNKKNRHARPLSTKHPIHLVIKSSQAKGAWSFLMSRNRRSLERTLKQMAKRYSIRVLEIGNSGNHCHFLLRITNRHLYKSFIRVFTGTIVRRICGAAKLPKRFFDFRPFSRGVIGCRGYQIARDYVWLNHLEGLGIIQSRKMKQITSKQRIFEDSA